MDGKRLERALSIEELNFVKINFLKPKLMKIFLEESTYLNEEEIAHRISMVSKGLLDLPSLMRLEKAWSAQEKNLKSEEKVSSFLDEQLLNT